MESNFQKLLGMIKPSLLKISIFITPALLFYLPIFISSAQSGANIVSAKSIALILESWHFPGILVCSFIPFCTQYDHGLITLVPPLFYISLFIAYGTSYFASCFIGILFFPFYNRFIVLVSSTLHITTTLSKILLFIAYILVLYILSYLMYVQSINNSMGGVRLELTEIQCNNSIEFTLRNFGFRDIQFSEVAVQIDEYQKHCEWEGSLRKQNLATCRIPLEDYINPPKNIKIIAPYYVFEENLRCPKSR